MHVLIVTTGYTSSSFNLTAAHSAVRVLSGQGHSTDVIDLHRDGFDPAENVERYGRPGESDGIIAAQRAASNNARAPRIPADYLRRVMASDLLIIQTPVWWHSVPAILKGFFDRVFIYGDAYTNARRGGTGTMRGKCALIHVTTGESEERLLERWCCKEQVAEPLNLSLQDLGFQTLRPQTSCGIGADWNPHPSAAEARKHHAETMEAWTMRLSTVEAECSNALAGSQDSAPAPYPARPLGTDDTSEQEAYLNAMERIRRGLSIYRRPARKNAVGRYENSQALPRSAC